MTRYWVGTVNGHIFHVIEKKSQFYTSTWLNLVRFIPINFDKCWGNVAKFNAIFCENSVYNYLINLNSNPNVIIRY